MLDSRDLELATARLRLRPVVETDADETAALVTPDVAENLMTWPSPMSREDALERVRKSQAQLAERKDVNFAILRKEDDQLLGWIGLAKIEGKTARLGYWVGSQYRNRGYTKEAALAAIDRAAQFLDLDAIHAFVRKQNAPSIRVLEQLGFEQVGEEPVYFQTKDQVEVCFKYVRELGPSTSQ